jgi:hypothetical protein
MAFEGIVLEDSTARRKGATECGGALDVASEFDLLGEKALRAWRYSRISLGKCALFFAASSAAGMRMVLSDIWFSLMRHAMQAFILIT